MKMNTLNTYKIFVSGGVRKKFRDGQIDCTYWHQKDELFLAKKLVFPCEIFNPDALTVSFFSSEERIREDFRALLTSNCILVDARAKRGIGVGAEIILAKMHKIPIYTLCPKDGHYRVSSEEREWIHPLIFEFSDAIFESIDDITSYLNELFKNEKLCMKQVENADEIIDKLYAFDAGYDEGYIKTKSFWGETPAKYVQYAASLLKKSTLTKVECLDLGCGHGKNSIFLHEQGFNVTAMDSSYYSVKEAREKCRDVLWKVRDIRKFSVELEKYNLIVLTGSLHCLSNKREVESVINNVKLSTCYGGYNVISAFNSGEQDLSGHSKDFHPILLCHTDYLNMYEDWNIIEESNEILEDIHPHNGIRHRHSITRLIAQKK